MARTYQWRAATRYNSDTSLSYGVTPSDKTSWQTANIGESVASQTWTWWYRDTNTASSAGWTDAVSTRVATRVTESWSTSVDDNNNLTVTVNVTIDSVVRDDVLGGGGADTPGRSINFYTSEGGGNVLSLTDYQVGTAHTIYSGPLNIGSYTFTIAPGGNYERSTMYLHNSTIGRASYDDIWMAIQFRNTLSADYRPGAVMSGSWQSTDRSSGACNIRTSSGWSQMRTINGGSATNNPPKILHSNNTWYNQRRVGNS